MVSVPPFPWCSSLIGEQVQDEKRDKVSPREVNHKLSAEEVSFRGTRFH